MRNLLLIALALSATTLALAQEWRDVKTPPTRQDMSRMYDLVRSLDPLDDPVKWQAATHEQSVKASVSAAEAKDGARGLRIHYEFSGRPGLQYVDIAGNVPIPDDVKSLGLWMRGGDHRLPVNVRITDRSGEYHQFHLAVMRSGEWVLGLADLANGGHWGGDDNGRLDPPLRLVSLIFDKAGERYQATGDLTICQLGVYEKRPARMQPHGLKLSVPQSQAMLVYEPGQAVSLRVQADPSDPALPALPVALTARLVDPFGQTAQTQTITMGSAEPVAFTVAPPGAGAYDLRFRLASRPDDLDGPWVDFRFAVIPTPLAGDATSPFGVSTHFVGWDPTTLMPLIARAGIKHYRDELYWGSVEGQKNQLAIPDKWRAYLTRGQQLGLEPLIIVDYTNGHWEPEGDFPIHPESRAAFARYAGFLAQQCPEVSNWEIWNEWCGGCGMKGRQGTAADYAPVFLASAKAIRDVNPKATVVGIGGEGDWLQFGPMMSQGAGAAMDAASIHPYMYPGLPGKGWADNLITAQKEALAASGKPLPLWITEIGWPTQVDARGSSYLHQARCLVRMIISALASDVHRIFWYDLKDDGTDLAYNENNFGLLHHDSYGFAPKPAYVAYAHLIRAVQGRQCGGWDQRDDAVRSVVFSGAGETVRVLWTETEEQTATVKLPARARVEDMFGRPVNAVGTVSVTQDPVFVIAPR